MNRKIKVRIKSASEEAEYTFYIDSDNMIKDVYYSGYTSQGQSGFADFIDVSNVSNVSETVMTAFRIQLEGGNE